MGNRRRMVRGRLAGNMLYMVFPHMTPAARDPDPATPGSIATDPGEGLTAFRVIRLDQPGPVVETAAPAVPAAPDTPAPRRATPLAPPTAKELAAAREIAQAAARPRLEARAAAARARRPAIEKKLAGAADSVEMLQVMDVELALQRARRLSGAGDKQREMMRVLSVFMLFGLVIAVVGAMWYLQTLRQGRTRSGRQPTQAVQTR